ncbi:MAG: gamma-glutamylcyclotransferase [Boseongicola sp. SB0676_bin_33]|nr:gamma-glutamylcyclotransferase [Boseongicola sp. SB0676_bin_33]
MTEEKVLDLCPLWVFGYASLLWNPGFPVAERRLATLRGYHRSFCMRSVHHRGTAENPGLVLALDKLSGASCQGQVMRVPDHASTRAIECLRERELISSAYLERLVQLEVEDGSTVTALTYVIDPTHVQYVSGLELEQQARIIARAAGGRGPNSEYLWNTADHLRELGIKDEDLDWLSARVHVLSGGGR